MKEFTLNADFGMTASDDGFALYGIHTGDMIMFKAAEDFPTNGSLVAVSIDDGPITLKRINFHGASMTCYGPFNRADKPFEYASGSGQQNHA